MQLSANGKSRIERDLLGEKAIPRDALYGIHSARAAENFPLSGRKVNPALIHAYGAVKLACALTNFQIGAIEESKFRPIEAACRRMMEGALDEHIIVDALQGGAGTSTNMNVNEVIANFAITSLGGDPGDYTIINPLDDVNLHQSTNDTYPTALRVAALTTIDILEGNLVRLLESLQRKEKQFSEVLKMARTELMDAIPCTLGMTFSAFAEAIARDRWRISKCRERLRVVNLGGTAVGTGLGAPKKYIFKAVENLRIISGHPLSRAENLYEATQNQDAIAESSGMLRVLASNLLKISNDIRLMASGPDAGFGEITLPPLQAGSSIMPGKINPVAPEAAAQAAMLVYGNDSVIAAACSSGNLELNHLMPLIADKFLENIMLLSEASKVLCSRCVEGIEADKEKCLKNTISATAALTALLPKIPYSSLCEIAAEAKRENQDIKQVAIAKGLISEKEFDELLSPSSLTRLGSD